MKGRSLVMFNEWNSDPESVASLLDVLAASLRDPSGGPKSPDELARDLRNVTNDRAAEFLTNLARVVRYLGPHATPLENMVEVVALLKARHALATIELAELDCALKQLFLNVAVLEETIGAVSVELAVSADAQSSECFNAVRDTVEHAHETLQQIVAAMREVCGGMDSWRLIETEGELPASRRRPS
jgi:hypothetical protein